jgi:hypothetical protein
MGHLDDDKETAEKKNVEGIARRRDSKQLEGAPAHDDATTPGQRQVREHEGNVVQGDADSKDKTFIATDKSTGISTPLKILEAPRTDPVKVLQTRQRRIERLSAMSMPEVGSINAYFHYGKCERKIDL